MELRDKRVLVVGLARTGEAVVRFLLAQGARVCVTDMKNAQELAAPLARLQGLPIGYELGYHDNASFRTADLVVVSPGVPMDIAPLKSARDAGVPVIAEIELASRQLTAPILAITGTNGKTTTTTLAGEIMKGCRFATFVGGNIGQPLGNDNFGQRGRPGLHHPGNIHPRKHRLLMLNQIEFPSFGGRVGSYCLCRFPCSSYHHIPSRHPPAVKTRQPEQADPRVDPEPFLGGVAPPYPGLANQVHPQLPDPPQDRGFTRHQVRSMNHCHFVPAGGQPIGIFINNLEAADWTVPRKGEDKGYSQCSFSRATASRLLAITPSTKVVKLMVPDSSTKFAVGR